jgi:hypothetical protein
MRKREFYEKYSGRKVDRIMVVTPFIHDKYPDKVKAMALSAGIKVFYPS